MILDLNTKQTPLTVTYDTLHLMKLDDDDPEIITLTASDFGKFHIYQVFYESI